MKNLVDLKSHDKRDKLPYTVICINDTKLISAEIFRGEKFARGCRVAYNGKGELILNAFHIAEFEEGWYKIGHFDSILINLSSNHITRLTSSTIFL